MRILPILFLLVLSVPARAGVFTVPLPELHGTYPYATPTEPYGRTASFHLPGTPAVVRGASLHLVGTTEVGTLICGAYVYPWPTETFAFMDDSPGHSWFAQALNPDVAGPFETRSEFVPYESPTWNFLLDGAGQITLSGNPTATTLGGCYTEAPMPGLTVTGAWLEVDADIPTPTSPSSWGALKAIYR